VRLFLDSNVWISALAASGRCEELLRTCLGHHRTLTSNLVRDECLAVIERKLRARPEALAQFVRLWTLAECVADAAAETGSNDARLLAAAGAAGAELFVTGDRAVLELRQVQSLLIVSPRDAWLMLYPPSFS
jgi:predicted nucleic acid-binding protein